MLLLLLTIFLTLLLNVSSAHNIQLKAHMRECFHEQLHADDKMTVTFQVGDREFGGSGNLDIDFWVHTTLHLHIHLHVHTNTNPLNARTFYPPTSSRIQTSKVHLANAPPFWGGQNLQLQNPSGAYQIHERTVSSGDHSFTAGQDGKYTYCFSNEAWAANTKEVSFNVHGIVYVPESEAPQDPLEKEVRSLSELVAQVKDEQGYIVVRERTHRNT
ncbi:hypothetical protein LTS18_008149, partial [Coniosporium uncinatum]